LRWLKRVEKTRWSSHPSALNNLLITYEKVLLTLDNIKTDENTDYKIGAKATGLIDFFISEVFINGILFY